MLFWERQKQGRRQRFSKLPPLKALSTSAERFMLDTISVVCVGDEYEGAAVIVSVPLGCLKAGDITFQPPMPSWKTEAIEKLGFGNLNKVGQMPDCLSACLPACLSVCLPTCLCTCLSVSLCLFIPDQNDMHLTVATPANYRDVLLS